MARTVTVYFATNRVPLTDPSGTQITDFGSELGPIDGTAVRFGSAQARIVGTGATFVPGSLQVAPEQLIGPNIQRGSRTIFDQLRDDMKTGGRATLIHIHGFSNTFRDAIERAAWIVDFYGIDANVFSFTWPSIGSALPTPLPYRDYFHDRATARASGVAIARTLRILYDFLDGLGPDDLCRQPLHLLCHSMGVFALRHAVQALLEAPQGEPREFARSLEGPGPAASEPAFPALIALPTEGPDPNRLRRTFDQIILAAGDEDEDAFEDPRELRYLPRLGNRVTVYHTPRDWILSTLSDKTKFNGPRLGVNGPENMGPISDKVTAVDVSDVIDTQQDFQGHQYYRLFPPVRDDIVAVLRGERQDTIANRLPSGSQRYRIRPAPRRRNRTA
ncbi:alpha/beta fold hydrolase [Methylobacterium sp. A49B]